MCTGVSSHASPAACCSWGSGHPSPDPLSIWLCRLVPPSAGPHDSLWLAAPGAPRAKNLMVLVSVPDCHPTRMATRSCTAGVSWPGITPALPPLLVTRHTWRCSTRGRHCFAHPRAFLVSPEHEQPTRGSASRTAAGTVRPRHLQLGLTPCHRTGLPSALPYVRGSQLEQPWRCATGIPGRQLEEFCPSEPKQQVPSHTNN